MSALGAVRRGRRAAERLMLDRCVVRRAAGYETLPTGEVVPAYEVTYQGRCKLQSEGAAYPSTPDAGGHTWTLTPLSLHLPVDGTDRVGPDQVVTVEASVDPANVGRRLRIRGGDRKTLQTAMRYLVEEVAD